MANSSSDTVSVMDSGIRLDISFEDCVRYHGRTSIGGVALGFRLVQKALSDLCPDEVPERAEISVRTAFPGPGLRDAIEMVTRAVTRGAYEIDTGAAPGTAPEAAIGRLWFEIRIRGRVAVYQAVSGAMSDEFIGLARKSHGEGLTADQNKRWTRLKEDLAAHVMAARAEDVLARVQAS